MKKFNCLLFIDDDYPTNFYHHEIAKMAEIADEMFFFQKAIEGIHFLKELKDQGKAHPEIIFLDINMPEINGWEFIEMYKEEIGKPGSEIFILTTSMNPDDEAKAASNEWISRFMNKPLSVDIFNELREEFLRIKTDSLIDS